MIVYAARAPQGLEHFVGKEVWVSVRLKHPYGFSFIRVLDFDGQNYTFNAIPERRLSKDGSCHCSETIKNILLEKQTQTSQYNIELHKPLELMTTDEIFVIDE